MYSNTIKANNNNLPEVYLQPHNKKEASQENTSDYLQI